MEILENNTFALNGLFEYGNNVARRTKKKGKENK